MTALGSRTDHRMTLSPAVRLSGHSSPFMATVSDRPAGPVAMLTSTEKAVASTSNAIRNRLRRLIR